MTDDRRWMYVFKIEIAIPARSVKEAKHRANLARTALLKRTAIADASEPYWLLKDEVSK